MKKTLSLIALLAFLAVPNGAFAWTYDGLGSLNPFTNFGRGFGGDCGCKVERCNRPKLTKCEKLHGVKIQRGQPCGCAAPVEYTPVIMEEPVQIETMPVIIDNMQNYPHRNYSPTPCTNCHRAF
ncbi:hypothetical protein IJ596_00330 [bacterium]|nr:hypothetical protein [bacterium]